MKHTILTLTLLLSFFSVSAQDVESTTTDTTLNAKIEQLLILSGSEKLFISAIDQMIGLQKDNPLYKEILPTEFWDDFSTEIHATGYESLKPEMIRIYKEFLTEEEVDHQIAYLGSPITQRIVAKQPELMKASMSIGAEWGKALGEKIAMKLQKALEEERN